MNSIYEFEFFVKYTEWEIICDNFEIKKQPDKKIEKCIFNRAVRFIARNTNKFIMLESKVSASFEHKGYAYKVAKVDNILSIIRQKL